MRKQILLTTVLCSFVFGMANAQLQTGKSESVIGFTSDVAQPNGNCQLMITFNTTKNYTDGSEGSNKINCNSTKGLAAAALTTEGINNNVADYFDQYHWQKGTNQTFKVKRYKDVPSLIAAHTDGTEVCSTAHNYWKCGNILMDVPGDSKDQAWAIWGGTAKRKVMFISFKGGDGLANLAKDIQFELLTLDKGTTGKTATYKMIVDLKENNFNMGNAINSKYGHVGGDDVALLDSITSANVEQVNAILGSKLHVADQVYTTLEDGALNRKVVKVAESIGLPIDSLRGKPMTIILYATTSGTSVQPGMYEPLVGVDNLMAEYSKVEWIEPADKVDMKDTMNVEVVRQKETPIKFKLIDKQRYAALTLTADGDNELLKSFYFNPEGSVMAKNPETGVYDVPVEYTYVPVTSTTPMKLTIPAVKGEEAVNDDLEITLFAKCIRDASFRLEVTNGVRFWKDILAKVVNETAIIEASEDENGVQLRVQNNTITVKNATERIDLFTLSGQILKSVSPEVASQGFTMPQGVYLIKTGTVVKKALVE